jgi:diguanylate cyclase (GGDEF)-like protein
MLVPMSKPPSNSESADLLNELAQLRGMVARLEIRIAELDRLAHNDPLVPLPNRRGFVRELERLLARLDRHGEPCAMLFVDLDGLKQLNDGHGHCAGDAALIHVAQLLVEGVRQSDTVARIGGDEFAVLLERSDGAQAAETAARLSERIARCVFTRDDVEIPLSVAIGVTGLVRGDTPESAIARADRAMYAIKAAA